jgi:hypothetical protein
MVVVFVTGLKIWRPPPARRMTKGFPGPPPTV